MSNLVTYENLLSSSCDYTNWSATGVSLTAANDPWGGTNATRITNDSLTNGVHRGYISSNTEPTSDPFFVTFYVKGTAGNVLFLFSSGSAFNLDLTDGTVAGYTDAVLVSAALVGNGWRKVVLQCTDYGTGVFQMCCDAPALSSTFTPPSTSVYVDIVPQLSNNSSYLPYHTTGTPVVAKSLPAGEAWQATAQGQTDILNAISSGGGTAIQNVLEGGVIALKQGDDHTVAADNVINLPQPDVGAALWYKLAQIDTTVTVGFRRNDGLPSEITGTVDQSAISTSNDVTTIPIEVPRSQTADVTHEHWKYDVQRTLADGSVVTDITGNATLLLDNA